MDTKLHICIATGIYPPEVGGPAEYASNLASEWSKAGHEVSVGVFSKWHFLPTGIRHIFFLFSITKKVWKADLVVVLDTFSAALPATVLGMIFGKKIFLRTGGDFLWEKYVERTGDMVLLSDFYKTSLHKLNLKEKIVFKIISFILRAVDVVIFSTKWQEEIFWHPYGLQKQSTIVIENFYGPKISLGESGQNKNFVASTRKLKWKNLDLLRQVFKEINAELYVDTLKHEDFLAKINSSYAVILASLGDISPNMILDAIRLNKPFIVTRETGIADRIKDVAIFVDPLSKQDIKEKVLWLLDDANYASQMQKIEAFSFTHTWQEMAEEYIDLYKNIK